MKKKLKWALIGLGTFLGLMLLLGGIGAIISGHAKVVSESPNKSDSVTASRDSVPAAPVVNTSSTWNYSDEDDKMTSKKIYFASIDANDELDLKPPYDGANLATLTVRYKSGDNVYLSVTKGQFMANAVDEEPIKVRFDSATAEIFYCDAPSDGSTTTLFITPTSKFIAKLKKAKKVLIQAEMYDNGIQEMEFEVNGFKWGH